VAIRPVIKFDRDIMHKQFDQVWQKYDLKTTSYIAYNIYGYHSLTASHEDGQYNKKTRDKTQLTKGLSYRNH